MIENRLLTRLEYMLERRDSMTVGPKKESDKHLLPVPLAPATWGDLRALIDGIRQ